MTESVWTARPRGGIKVIPGVKVHEHGSTMRGRSASITDSDSLLAASIDELGTVDTFGLSRTPGGPASAEIQVPARVGPVVLLTQDLESGRWSWKFPAGGGGTRRFVLQLPNSTEAEDDRSARVLVKVIAFIGSNRFAGDDAWKLDQWERMNRRVLMVTFPQVHSPHTVETSDAGAIAGGSSLLLLHDVFGSTAGTFGALPRYQRAQFDDVYHHRVWGFDHPTLTATPLENAERLVGLLAERSLHLRVDILGVGRGGLVAAELAAMHPEWLQIDSITFAGVPLGGTPLLTLEHRGAFLDRYTNLTSLVPENPITTTLDSVCALATQLADQRDIELGGLTAMATGFQGELPDGTAYLTIAGTGAREQDDEVQRERWTRRLEEPVLDSLLGPHHDEIVNVENATTPALGSAAVIEGVSHRQLVSTKKSADRIARLMGLPSETRAPTQTRGWSPQAAAKSRRYTLVPPVKPERMHLTAVHGTIALEPDTVLVGHFLGTSLTGSEAAIDVRTRGRMSVRHLARLYPSSLGESEVLSNTVADGGTDFPKKVVIVGLGTPEELTRVGLADTVTAGLLKLALAEAERLRPNDVRRVIKLSTPLIGTGGLAPLPVETSITAIADGVLAANSRLREIVLLGETVFDRVHFGDVRFVELQEDIAEIASRTVGRIRDLVRAGSATYVDLTASSALELGDGRWPRRLVLDGEPDWQRVVVRESSSAQPPNRPTVAFTLIGRSAATGEEQLRPNMTAVSKLLDDVVTAGSEDSAATLYRLLVPQRLRAELAKADNLHFIVDEATAAYPWEALIAGEGRAGSEQTISRRAEEAISRRAGFIRQFVDTERTRGRPNLGDRRHALVIGNPPTHFPALPQARAEAVSVADRLDQGGFKTKLLCWPPPEPTPSDGPTGSAELSAEILRELTNGGYRILHIAAHGIVDNDGDPDRTGIVIGPEWYVTADDVRNLDDVSELVFLNCCHLAAKPALAANLARTFMQSGSQVVIAAGWPIGDDTAERFADRFYLEMLEGANFGTAVRQARRAAFTGPADTTWAAYQCYGDPGYRLQPRRARFAGTTRMVSAAEFLREIDIIKVRASDVGRRGGESRAKSRAALLAELRALHDSQIGAGGTPTKWLSAVAYAALADAALELGDYALAIGWYSESLKPDKALGPVKALEQLGNAQVRYATQLARRGEPHEKLLQASLENLETALRLGRTTERLSLLGSHWKKRAVIAARRLATTSDAGDADARDNAVRKACVYYGCAARRAPDNPYPVLAWVQLAHLSRGCTTALRRKRLERVEESSAERDPDFWQRAASGDAALTRLVIGEPNQTSPDAETPTRTAVREYGEAFAIRSSWRERDSVLEHIHDLTALADGEPAAALEELLEKLLDVIQELGQDE